ncbi:uncharacterized protein FA14DRAFT_72915 [Meira miltonrushii]|uniref:Uncharacterized protein n=1 Tax=Meira miltonrushii TaxID=1280837 RepID=A0A316VB31_9BASI|nr:uncharacterized protein FA14DRAFT_72915 [Meira miltonrushii]PWN34474.1 hypothetical protein FA14DRAFT_72915 [Meira miltonrushii]
MKRARKYKRLNGAQIKQMFLRTIRESLRKMKESSRIHRFSLCRSTQDQTSNAFTEQAKYHQPEWYICHRYYSTVPKFTSQTTFRVKMALLDHQSKWRHDHSCNILHNTCFLILNLPFLRIKELVLRYSHSFSHSSSHSSHSSHTS